MEESELRKLLGRVRRKSLSVGDAIDELKHLPFEDLGFAKLDHHRSIRCGFPEVVYCEGKTIEQVVAIIQRRVAGGGNVLATRASAEVVRAVKRKVRKVQYNKTARTISIRQNKATPRNDFAAIVCAGTSDLPVAEEARETCEIMDQPTKCFYDVGVAGIHRLLAHSKALSKARVVVVCAGMEGALASVVGGLVACPVIAVPTSVGYGASFQGLAPLLTMLNSCAAGVSVVNIDNGFGAGYIAALICRAAANAPCHSSDEPEPAATTKKKTTRRKSKKRR